VSDDIEDDPKFAKLIALLCQVPAVEHNETPSLGIGRGFTEDGWWVKFGIDIAHPLAWTAVQELGHVLNYLSLDEKLPTVFMPVSPPPYMNGGPREYLSWVIQCFDKTFEPDNAAQWLEGRLPKPIADAAAWGNDD
jgi:hypothetical protein